MRKDQRRSNTRPETPWNGVYEEDQQAKSYRKPWIYIKCHSSNSFRPIKSPNNATDTTVRRSSVDREDRKSEKSPYFSRWSTSLLFTSFSKTLLTIKRRLKRPYFFATNFFPTFLNTGTRDETCRHIMKSSAGMYESLGSQFFRSNTGIQSGPDAFEESGLVGYTNLTIAEILCSLRLVLKRKVV